MKNRQILWWETFRWEFEMRVFENFVDEKVLIRLQEERMSSQKGSLERKKSMRNFLRKMTISLKIIFKVIYYLFRAPFEIKLLKNCSMFYLIMPRLRNWTVELISLERISWKNLSSEIFFKKEVVKFKRTTFSPVFKSISYLAKKLWKQWSNC